MATADRVRSFVDLRAFAADASGPERAGSDFLADRRPLPLVPGPVAIAAFALQGAGQVEAMPADEFLILLAGELRFADPASSRVLTGNDSVVLPQGTAFDWHASAGTRLIAMRAEGAPGADAIVPIDHAAPLEASGAPLADLLVGPAPSCRNHTDYRSASGEFLCGTWDSTPYHRLPMRYRHYELMHLLDGSVTFEDEAGTAATFSSGDIFLVEQGARCSWRSEAHVKKVYAIYRPA